MNRRGIPAAIRCGAGIPTCCLAGFQTCLAVGESRRSGTGYGSARGPSAGQSDRNVCTTISVIANSPESGAKWSRRCPIEGD